PTELGGIRLVSLGRLPRGNAAFHSQHHLFPAGFRCEQTVPSLAAAAATGGDEPTQLLVACEIAEHENGYPQFRVTPLARGETFSATSEPNVWAKVRESSVSHEMLEGKILRCRPTLGLARRLTARAPRCLRSSMRAVLRPGCGARSRIARWRSCWRGWTAP